MSKKQTKTAKAASSNLDREGLLASLGELIKKHKARVSPIDWANALMDGAEQYVGEAGESLLNKTIKISEAAKGGKVVKLKKDEYHFTTYANKVREDLLASGKVQRRALPVVVNVTKMAVAFLLKEPISMEFAISFVEAIVDEAVPRLQNILSSYLNRIVPIAETEDLFFDHDFTSVIEKPIKEAYAAFVTEHWDELTGGK